MWRVEGSVSQASDLEIKENMQKLAKIMKPLNSFIIQSLEAKYNLKENLELNKDSSESELEKKNCGAMSSDLGSDKMKKKLYNQSFHLNFLIMEYGI